MNRAEQILMAEEFVRQKLKGYDSGHDWWHIVRVRNLAKFINEMELLADPFEVDITALLHDAADSKFAGSNSEEGYQFIRDFMNRCEMSDLQEKVINVIKKVSFSAKDKIEKPNDPLLWVIQDADRLDAIGAIGIARAFNYGGFRNNPIYFPGEESGNSGSSTIGHFYKKLLLLKEMMNTTTGRKIAEDRHKILENYLEQFYREWYFMKDKEEQQKT